MELPEIGYKITPEYGKKMCEYFGFDEIAERIEDNNRNYANIDFDGCSGLPSNLLYLLIGAKWLKVRWCCFRHDLKYIYGVPGDENAREQADYELEQDLINIAKVGHRIAGIFYEAVRLGGEEEYDLGFSWACGSKGR